MSSARKYLDLVSTMDESLEEHDEKYHPEGYREGDTCNKRSNQAKGDEADGLNPAGESRKDESGADAPDLDDLPEAPEPTEEQLEREYKYPKMSIMREINAMSDTRVKLDDGSDAFVEGAYFYDIAPGADGNSFSVSSNCGRSKSVDAICKAAEKGKMFKAWSVKKSGGNAAVLTKKDADGGDDDAAYMDAVSRGDMTACEKMVREAAKRAMPNTKIVDRAGNPKVVYHGTDTDIYKNGCRFSEDEIGSSSGNYGYYGYGFYFTVFKEEAEEYATSRDGKKGYVGAFYVNIENPKELWDSDPAVATLNYHSKNDAQAVTEKFRKEGHDGVWGSSTSRNYSGEWHGEVIPYSPTQIKSADPVTYDDSGNVIPLSKRFDMRNPDIRY